MEIGAYAYVDCLIPGVFPPGVEIGRLHLSGTGFTSTDALEWLATMCSHVPDKRELMVRYYGYYSNVCRGKRRKENQDEWIPCILESD